MKMFKTLSSLLSTFFFFAIILIVVIISNLWRFSQSLPDYRQLEKYEPAVTTRLYAGDGQLLKEYAVEQRLFMPVGKIPDLVIPLGNRRRVGCLFLRQFVRGWPPAGSPPGGFPD